MTEFKELSEEQKRDVLVELYDWLEQDQKEFFVRVHRCNVGDLPFEKLEIAHRQIVRQIEKNESGGAIP